jgi:hypothetical protein
VKIYPHSLNPPSWRGARLKHRDNFKTLYSIFVWHFPLSKEGNYRCLHLDLLNVEDKFLEEFRAHSFAFIFIDSSGIMNKYFYNSYFDLAQNFPSTVPQDLKFVTIN